ncbi:hypothetical protein PC112_g21570 [Phytophthora cactorum]|nr:hypothetical protein PC112_g21570 [Phytophthora cactorum]
MAPEQVPALLPTEALLAGLKLGSPLRTVLSPAAPERGTGGMSPEVGPFESRPEEGDGLEAASGNSESPSIDTGSASNTENPASTDLSELLPESQGDDAATPDDDNVNDRGSEDNNNSDDDGDSDDNDNDGMEQCPLYAGTPSGSEQLDIKTLRKNLYDGDGAGPMAIVRRVLPDDKGVRVLKPGVYLVAAYKRNMRAHCFALKVTTDEDMIVRENGVDSGIGDQRWLRMLKFIRRIKVRQNGD